MAEPLYTIRDWDTIYETAETRKLENLRWVPTPNKHDGLGYRRVAAHRDRCELFTAWNLIVQVASKGRKGERGKLQRDGRPMGCDDLALVTGFPPEIFRKALPFFSDPKLGWLLSERNGDISASPASAIEQSSGSPGSPASSPGRPADAPAEWKGMEGNGNPIPEVVAAEGGGKAEFPKAPLQRRAEKLFKRRETTVWDGNECKAWERGKAAVAATAEEDWQLLEWFYALPPHLETYRRRDLATLLNNWGAEIDRARDYRARNPVAMRAATVRVVKPLQAMEGDAP